MAVPKCKINYIFISKCVIYQVWCKDHLQFIHFNDYRLSNMAIVNMNYPFMEMLKRKSFGKIGVLFNIKSVKCLGL